MIVFNLSTSVVLVMGKTAALGSPIRDAVNLYGIANSLLEISKLVCRIIAKKKALMIPVCFKKVFDDFLSGRFYRSFLSQQKCIELESMTRGLTRGEGNF